MGRKGQSPPVKAFSKLLPFLNGDSFSYKMCVVTDYWSDRLLLPGLIKIWVRLHGGTSATQMSFPSKASHCGLCIHPDFPKLCPSTIANPCNENFVCLWYLLQTKIYFGLFSSSEYIKNKYMKEGHYSTSMNSIFSKVFFLCLKECANKLWFMCMSFSCPK